MNNKLPLKIIFLNVQHGDGIIVLLPHEEEYEKAMIIDCNDGIKAYNVLKDYNINFIESVVITHFHSDHYRGFDILLNKLKEEKINTCIDTSGMFNITEDIKEVLKYTDLVLLDIKHIDDEKCKDLVGFSNNKELELPVTYYKGYKAYSNNHELEIEKSKNGLIQIQNSENLKNVKVIYKGTIIQKITKYISLVFYIGLIGYIIKKKYMKKTNKNK